MSEAKRFEVALQSALSNQFRIYEVEFESPDEERYPDRKVLRGVVNKEGNRKFFCSVMDNPGRITDDKIASWATDFAQQIEIAFKI